MSIHFKKLVGLAENAGIKVSIGGESSYCCTNTSIINLKPDDENTMTIVLAHELGHFKIQSQLDSNKQFPHLRLFKKDGKMRLKSNKFCRSMYAEEMQAWNYAEELIRLLDPELISMIKYFQSESIQTYRNAVKRTVK